MREPKKYMGTHEFTNKTQRMIRYTEQNVTRKDADFPYPYISKGLFDHLGQPYVIRITIEAVESNHYDVLYTDTEDNDESP